MKSKLNFLLPYYYRTLVIIILFVYSKIKERKHILLCLVLIYENETETIYFNEIIACFNCMYLANGMSKKRNAATSSRKLF